MSKRDAIIRYIYHSGFQVETAGHLFIFDYMQGDVKFGDKDTFVFSSHSHPDHFNPVIFDWEKEHPGVTYILSDEINPGCKGERLYSLPPYREILVGDVTIKTFGSTDLGVSFLLKADDVSIFHAGDLNWWHWWGDTPENIAQAEKDYKKELTRIKGEQIDIAFFPVDQRLEQYYALGADTFIDEISPKILVPMHFGDHPKTAQAYAEKMKNSPTKIITLTDRGEEIKVSL